MNLIAKKNFLSLVFFIMMITSQAFAGTVYYVDAATGNDTNSGTESLPWRTIQKAADKMVAGDTVMVKNGTYNGRVTESTNGSQGQLITYQAYPGHTVKVVGGFNLNGNYIRLDGFQVTGASPCNSKNGAGIFITGSYIEVVNCHSYENKEGGLDLSPSSNHCTIKNNKFSTNGGRGALIEGTNHFVENNEVYDSRCAPCNSDADGFIVFGSGHTFRGNYIHDISYSNNPGYSPHIDAFQSWQDQYHSAIQNSVFEKNWIDLPDYKDAAACTCGFMLNNNNNLIIRNNIVKAFRGTNTDGGNCINIKIINNNFIGDLYWPVQYGPQGINVKRSSNCIVKNNIFVEQPHIVYEVSGATGLDIDYNCTYNSNNSIPTGTPQAHDLWAVDPRFVDLSRGNYRLQADSPCIDAGATLPEVGNDYDGTSRPQGPFYDIGAYEFKGVRATIPIASFTAYPIEGMPPLLVSFNASASRDPDGTITSYNWDFGDGSTDSGVATSHTYQKSAIYTARLTVTDNANKSASTLKMIIVGARPVASFVASPTAGRPPLTVNFDASSSYDPDGTIVSYSWDFGDGTSGTGKIVTHIYTTEAIRIATLFVQDDIGLEANSSQEIEIALRAIAKFTANPRKGEVPLKVSFDASESEPSAVNGKITSYVWDFGDGTGDSGEKVTHTYAKTGRFTATLKVTDDKAKTNSASTDISVYSKPKALFSFSPTNGIAPLPVTFNASASYDIDGKIVSYLWSFGDKKTGTGRKISHTYTKGGNLTIVLIVTDNDGYTDSLSKTIDVFDKPFPPLNVKVTKMIDKDQFRSEAGYIVEWSKNPLNEGKFNIASYRIYRKKENEDLAGFTLIAEVSSNIFVYEDSSLSTQENIKGYTYAVSSLDDKNRESDLSSPDSSQNLNPIVYTEPNKNLKFGKRRPVNAPH